MKLFVKLLHTLLILVALSFSNGAMAVASNAASQQGQTQQLRTALEQAAIDEIFVAAPIHFNKAQKQYAAATKKLNNDQATRASEKHAAQGLLALRQGRAAAQKNRELLADAFEQRKQALAALAKVHYPEQTKKLHKKLVHAAELIELGKEKQAASLGASLATQYQQLAEFSLKATVTDKAREALAAAEQAKAKKYAPKTFNQAEEQFAFIDEVLQSKHREMAIAKEYALKATHLSHRARNVALLAKEFDLQKLDQEDVIRWHYAQLDEIAKALGLVVNYQLAHKDALASIVQQANGIKVALKQTSNTISKQQRKMHQVERKFAEKLTNQQLSSLSKVEYERRFGAIKKLFKPTEATVYRDENDVLIKAHGFDFPIGKSIIEARNYPLVEKIIASIDEFPQFKRIVVSGHTDSTGNAKINQPLSKARAQSMKALLVSLAKIPADKIEVHGFGDAQPVSNEAQLKGRALNRRIEVRIVN